MKYPPERKQAVIAKMLPPHNKSIAELARQERISVPTLYSWRKEARRAGRLLADGETSPSGWSSVDKFAAVLESAALNETELSEYCGKRGLYPEQVKQWRIACRTDPPGTPISPNWYSSPRPTSPKVTYVVNPDRGIVMRFHSATRLELRQ